MTEENELDYSSVVHDAQPVTNGKDSAATFKGLAVVVVLMVLLASLSLVALDWSNDEDEAAKVGDHPLADNYMIFVDEPTNDEEMALVYALSCLTVRDGQYFPLQVLGEDGLDDHQLWTLQYSANKEAKKYVFSNGAQVTVEQQLRTVGADAEIELHPFTANEVNTVLRGFLENEGPYQFEKEIKVSSHHEALWVSGLAAQQNAIITYGNSGTYSSQEKVWEAMDREGIPAGYVLVANPDDYLGDDIYFSIFNGVRTSYHYPSMSVVAAEIAAYRQAYVVTQTPGPQDIVIPEEYTALFPEGDPANRDLDDEMTDMYLNNVRAYAYYLEILEVHQNYGPSEYLCLV